MLSKDSQLSGKMSPLLLYGTNPDISGDICRKIDRTFITEIFELIKTALYKVYGTDERLELPLRGCVLYCSKQGICTANSKYNSPDAVVNL